MATNEAFAPAKINLTLHVTGQREDGYHTLDSVVMFADLGDHLTVEMADSISLEVTGPMAAGVPADDSNLAWRAAQLMETACHITLDKHLPPAAGIGGGSSDAAAVLRILSDMTGRAVPDAGLALGADVPMCLRGVSGRVGNIGETIQPLTELSRLPVVLANPGIALSTPAVFAALENKFNAPMPDESPEWKSARGAAAWLAEQRNDLEPVARRLAPEIDQVLAALDDALLARMSGSGATCFGLYPSWAAAQEAAASIASDHPEWWVKAARLG